jgi:uncharacterized protein (TIGR02217 family)
MTTLPYPTVGVITSTDLTTNADVFPQLPGTDFLTDRSPIFSTGLKTAASGREIRTAYRSAPLYQWSVAINVLRARPAVPEVAKLMGFFSSRQGRYACFFYLDPVDNAVVTEPFGTGDGATTTFQLSRQVGRGTTYPGGPEPVYACWLTPTIYVNGVSTAAFTVGPWGVVTFVSPPAAAAALTWTGSYLFVCRFDQDDLPLQQIVKDLWSQKGLKFMSLKP